MIKTEIYFFRHAQTIWNLQRRFQGQQNSKLSELGIEQSKNMKKKIEAINPEVFITSGLDRTKETLFYALEGSKIEPETVAVQEFNEASFGCWEGMLIDDVKNQYDDHFKVHQDQPHLFHMKDAESYEEVQRRALNGVKWILNEYPGKKIAVITHGMVLLCLIGYIRNIPIKNIREKVTIPDNTDYFKICWFR